MLEELIACFLSLFSALTLDAPRISWELNDHASHAWEDKILHREQHVSFEEETEYVQVGYELRNKPTYTQSLLRSPVKANVAITLAVLPLVLIYRNGSYIFRFKNSKFMF
jgi:hypothetical protein